MTNPQASPSLSARVRRALLLGSLATLTALIGCSGSGGGAPAPAPAPSVASVTPASVPVGSTAFTISIVGANFRPGATVSWNTTPLATTYVSATSLSATVPASLAATGILANITVTNPDGQSSLANTTAQQVAVDNPLPTLTTVSPSSLYAGTADTTFTLTGTNFMSSSVVMVGTTSLTTTFVSSTQLTAVVPAATLAPVGALSFSVSNPAPGGGSSQAISVTLRQPAAKLTSLSPASATVGSAPVTVTLTGAYFTPTSAVYIGNFTSAPTTYVSPTSIQFTIASSLLTNTGTLNINVRDPASQNIASNTLNLQVVNPVPVLNSISPATVTAGAPNFSLTLTGTNFVQSATVQINGTSVSSYLYPSATSATVTIPASAVTSVGNVNITITNPAPGGGTSAAQTLHVISADNRIRTINLPANDLGWDSTHNLIVASSGSSITNTPNVLVTIDPLQGSIVTTQPLPSSPAGISVTDDGSFVYVTLPSAGQVERFTLPSLTPDITFSLGNDANGKFYMSNFVAAAPGHPHTVAITRHSSTTTAYGADGGVVVYDDGVPRTNIAFPGAYPNYYDDITWGADATTLYATNSAISFADEAIFNVTANGVALQSDQASVLNTFAHHLAYEPKTGRLLDDGGLAVNAATGQQAGLFQFQPLIAAPYDAPFALDLSQRKAFFQTSSNVTGSTQTSISAFDLDHYSYLSSMVISGLGFGSAIVRWGSSGLAVAGSQIYLVDGSFVSLTGIASAVGGYSAPSPTLSSMSPVSVTAGSPDVQVTLNGHDFTQASVVTWNNQKLLVDSVSDTQLVVTIPAASLTNPVGSAITVTNGPGTGSSGALAFTVLPNLGASAQMSVLDISGQDLVWDQTHSLLYIAVPSSDPINPNTIVVVDPATTTLKQTIPVAQGPSSIAISDDAQYLYSGFFDQAIVQRYTLPSFGLDLTFASGGHAPSNLVGLHGTCTFAVGLKVAPGNPQTVAVAEGQQNIEPPACGGLDIYDNATPRPGYVPYYTAQDFGGLAWGADATTLYGQSQIFEPQTLSAASVSPSGVTLTGTLNTGNFGRHLHYLASTGLLYSDSGVITNPAGHAQVTKLASGGADFTVPDDVLKRIFVLTHTATGTGSGQGAVDYTLSIYDLNTYALLHSVTIPGVLGTPMQMARWGTSGMALVTSGSITSTSPGTLYLLQGSALSGTP